MNDHGESSFDFQPPSPRKGNSGENGVSPVERFMQEDFGWGLSTVDDMCEPWSEEVQQGITDMDYVL